MHPGSVFPFFAHPPNMRGMKTSNTLPKAIDELMSLGHEALTGAESIGDEIDLSQNTAPKIATDVFALSGNPATPAVPGAQAAYVAQKAVVGEAYRVGAIAVKAGREFCRIAISVLKPTLGTRWNSQWNAAGFTSPTLAVPAEPVPVLIRFREYLNAHPDREIPALGVTAAAAQQTLATILAANLAIGRARESLVALKAARDTALRKLKKRLSGLRAELEQILEPGDGRWYDFGFIRPLDGRKPARVAEVSATPAGEGMVIVNWKPAALAESYRVTWRAANQPADETGETEIVRDTQWAFTNLPPGERIVIAVAARNRSGESAPREIAATIPRAPDLPNDAD
jgi:hypothetical protein